ncbi:hypothetical protein PHLCEN_2v5088 [Hermanssonia centrifuga]|uniref:Uncharacterized protein n=1 Tax=Hermanssonia centrifuga TaxID=98765 RepID=A0A2R6PBX3_9APHY|nr:hypothetical protein PHLCEN_2v5088 [Hermanssonia centrifuga]
MGYPPAQKGGIKRPGEAVNSPDPKRGKMQPTPNQPQTSQSSPRANGSNPPAANIQKSSQVTPTISHAIPPAQAVQQPSAVPQPQIQHSAAQPTTSSPASQPPAPAQNVPPRQPTPSAQPNTSNNSVPNPQPNQPLASSLQGMSQQWSMLERFAEQLKLTERALLAKAGEINNLRANGKTKEADEHLERLTPELRKLAQARQLLQVKRLALRGQVPEPGQSQAIKANSSATEFQHIKMETGETATQATGQASGPSQPQLSQATGMHPNPTESQLAAQMQKLIEQRNRTPHVPPTNISAIDPASGSGHAATESQPNTIIWKGAFVWRGLDSVPMSIQVMVPLVARGTPIRADNWPSSMTLTSSPEPAAPLPMLNEWIKKHNCAPFPIQILPGGDAPHNNENQYKALVRLLAEKNVYALAGWNGPNGTLENKILIFAIKAQQLGGAFYPGPGSIPDMPKASIDLANAASPFAMILSKLSTEQQALLAQLPPEKRLAQLKSMVLRHQAQLSQTRSQQQPQRPMNSWENSGGFFGGQTNATSVLNASASLPPQVPSGATMMSYNLPQVHPQGMVTSPSLHQRNISGSGNTGGVGGVSYEMLQSFMQRSGTNGQG